MTNWCIKQSKWDEPEQQAVYGDDQTIVITDAAGKEVCWIAVTELIESLPPRFIFQHSIECVRQGAWKPDADGLGLAGEIPCWAQMMERREATQQSRKRKARA